MSWLLRTHTEEQLARSRRLLTQVALGFGVAALLLSTVVGLVGMLWLDAEVVRRHNQHIDIFSASWWLGLAAYARTNASHQAVLRAGRVVIVGACVTLACVAGLNAAASAGQLPVQSVTWATVWIVAYPLLIPSPPRTTRAVVSSAAVGVPLGTALGMAAWGGPVDAAAVAGSAVAPVVAAVLAGLGADLVARTTTDTHRLREREGVLSAMLQRVDEAVELRTRSGQLVFSSDQRAPRDVLEADGLVVHADERAETWLVTHNDLVLDGAPHRLTVAKRLTHHVEAAEVESWKRLIRVLSHELNNSLAPMSSLLHSMRQVVARPEKMSHLDDLIGSMDRRIAHLTQFLSEYSAFARLPRPRAEEVPWQDFVDGLAPLMPFTVVGPLDGVAFFDRGQLEQAAVNLLHNAHESGSPRGDIQLSVQRDPDHWVLSVADRGSGLSDEVVARAVLPFFSTKTDGTGLGLALCRDIAVAHGGRLALCRREGGGAVARLWLPIVPPEVR